MVNELGSSLFGASLSPTSAAAAASAAASSSSPFLSPPHSHSPPHPLSDLLLLGQLCASAFASAAEEAADRVLLGTRWGRRLAGLQPHMPVTVEPFEER